MRKIVDDETTKENPTKIQINSLARPGLDDCKMLFEKPVVRVREIWAFLRCILAARGGPLQASSLLIKKSQLRPLRNLLLVGLTTDYW